MNKFIPLAAAFLTVAFGTAHAAPEPRSQTVRFADLDTNSLTGAAVLFGRIKLASESVCQDLSSKSLSLRRLYRDCLDTAMNAAVSRVNRPMLSRFASTHGYHVMDLVARNN